MTRDAGNERKEIVLETENTTVTVSDGQKIGAVLRNIAFVQGYSKEQAQEIHREHIRLHIGDNGVVMEVLGGNPTVLEGHSLSKGDRVNVPNGATLELSGILEATVRLE